MLWGDRDTRAALFYDAMRISELINYYSTDTDNSISHLHQSRWQDCLDGLRKSSAPSVDGLPLKFQ